MTDFARNRKAFHDFHIEETYEAGLTLTGPEVKSVRAGRANLKESYARIKDGEAFLIGSHISPYENAAHTDQHPTRDRKLLLHRKEIDRLIGKSQEERKTLIPLKLYSKKRRHKAGNRRRQPQERVRQAAGDRQEDRQPGDGTGYERTSTPLIRGYGMLK